MTLIVFEYFGGIGSLECWLGIISRFKIEHVENKAGSLPSSGEYIYLYCSFAQPEVELP